ncbi:MAG: galactokinase [Ruminiclostridium sp.]|nr:galactokinase [Ruminiclostridium sp.]MBR4112417.1 galactokinase [Ruminiclostridium sp.]
MATQPILATLDLLYKEEALGAQKARYEKAIASYKDYFSSNGEKIRLFSAPGRTEVGGNHTDHNCGKVLAASVDMDIIAVVEPLDDPIAVVKSEGFDESWILLEELDVVESEKNTTNALIRGVAKGFKNKGLKVGGFKAYATSNVLKGSGLSSSAAFENLIGTIFSYLYNEGKVNPVKIAQISQYAENVYFGKPSGLMDQMASSVGGFVAIDFKDVESPIIENVNVDFDSFGHALCIIDTKGDHADLTPDYAAIPAEMKAIANYFSVPELRHLCKHDIILNINALRVRFGDRAVLRALHFFEENKRVEKLVNALKRNDFQAFLDSINESGNSSYKYLQNVYSNSHVEQQGLGIGLNIAEFALQRKGASRVHGGGFAGTIQAFVPFELLKEFKMEMEKVFGGNTCHVLKIRPVGGCEVTLG